MRGALKSPDIIFVARTTKNIDVWGRRRMSDDPMMIMENLAPIGRHQMTSGT
jgi:hypothetical protein